MDKSRPVSRELETLLPVLAETMKFATQALSQSSALADVLIAKSVVTKAELDAKMSQGQKLRDSLMNMVNEQVKRQS
jgi:hypothetical protein